MIFHYSFKVVFRSVIYLIENDFFIVTLIERFGLGLIAIGQPPFLVVSLTIQQRIDPTCFPRTPFPSAS